MTCKVLGAFVTLLWVKGFGFEYSKTESKSTEQLSAYESPGISLGTE